MVDSAGREATVLRACVEVRPYQQQWVLPRTNGLFIIYKRYCTLYMHNAKWRWQGCSRQCVFLKLLYTERSSYIARVHCSYTALVYRIPFKFGPDIALKHHTKMINKIGWESDQQPHPLHLSLTQALGRIALAQSQIVILLLLQILHKLPQCMPLLSFMLAARSI